MKYRSTEIVEATQWNEGDALLPGMHRLGQGLACRQSFMSSGDWLVTGPEGLKSVVQDRYFRKEWEPLPDESQ